MILFLILAIIIILLKIFFSIDLKLEIENLRIELPKNKITNKDSKISLKIYILNKIKIAEINLKKIDLKSDKVKSRLQKQFKGNKFNLDTIKLLNKVNYIIEKLNLKVYIGTEDAAITAIGVGIGYTIVSNFISGKILGYENIEYEIFPIYQNKNILKLELDSIITLKMENIIDIIKLIKKGRVDKNGRTSNRRAYAYSNE
ncbi:MAG: DUF2953 domain-containing protein [Clostridia bacterium]|nr:DUF2953 domain-containing protein [Clostridia bacterium]